MFGHYQPSVRKHFRRIQRANSRRALTESTGDTRTRGVPTTSWAQQVSGDQAPSPIPLLHLPFLDLRFPGSPFCVFGKGFHFEALITGDVQGVHRGDICPSAAIMYKLPANHQSHLGTFLSFFPLSGKPCLLGDPNVSQLARVSSGISLMGYAKYGFHFQVGTWCISIIMCPKVSALDTGLNIDSALTD